MSYGIGSKSLTPSELAGGRGSRLKNNVCSMTHLTLSLEPQHQGNRLCYLNLEESKHLLLPGTQNINVEII